MVLGCKLVLREHLLREKDRLRHVHEAAKAAAAGAAELRAKDELLSVMDVTAAGRGGASDTVERRRLMQSVTSADAAYTGLGAFAREFGPFLAEPPAAAEELRMLLRQREQVRELLGPCRELLGLPLPPKEHSPATIHMASYPSGLEADVSGTVGPPKSNAGVVIPPSARFPPQISAPPVPALPPTEPPTGGAKTQTLILQPSVVTEVSSATASEVQDAARAGQQQ